jgi:hypothetical protein
MTIGSPDDQDELKRLAKTLHRPLKNLLALSHANDPYNLWQSSRVAGAHWFAALWHGLLGQQARLHDRRIHYRLVSQEEPVALPDGRPFLNTHGCWEGLCDAVRDARYHNLIPSGVIIDRRNPEPLLFDSDAEAASDAAIITTEGVLSSGTRDMGGARLLLPRLILEPPVIPQRYLLETWMEKTTVNDIVEPLGRRYRMNVVPFLGESSAIRCDELIQRVREAGKPCRIFYISDFDPAGTGMPVATARKIEFLARKYDLDIQVRTVALTHDQCVEFRLPRTPIKETEIKAARFEECFGEGGTERDALEALHPGALARILED